VPGGVARTPRRHAPRNQHSLPARGGSLGAPAASYGARGSSFSPAQGCGQAPPPCATEPPIKSLTGSPPYRGRPLRGSGDRSAVVRGAFLPGLPCPCRLRGPSRGEGPASRASGILAPRSYCQRHRHKLQPEVSLLLRTPSARASSGKDLCWDPGAREDGCSKLRGGPALAPARFAPSMVFP